jgi:hypothetical protein
MVQLDEVLGKNAIFAPALSPLAALRQPPDRDQDEQIAVKQR